MFLSLITRITSTSGVFVRPRAAGEFGTRAVFYSSVDYVEGDGGTIIEDRRCVSKGNEMDAELKL